jgi:RNA 2',3'-cyclic 3'-phosphodiesterase
MRLFIGIEIAPAIAAATLELIAQLQTVSARVAPRSRIAWVTRDRLHITVRFIGHVDDPRGDTIRDVLAPPFGLDPFDLTIAGVGTFPPKGPPRVVWAGLGRGRDHLLTLERMVSVRLAQAGVPQEDRPYNPHLTLARVRDAAGLRPAPLVENLHDVALGTTSVDAITLFESRLSPKGPAYVALARTPLSGSELAGTERRTGGA